MKKQNNLLIVEKTTGEKWDSTLSAYLAAHYVMLLALEKGIYCTMRLHHDLCAEVTLFLDYPKELAPFNNIVASRRRYRSMKNIDHSTGLRCYTRVVEFSFYL